MFVEYTKSLRTLLLGGVAAAALVAPAQAADLETRVERLEAALNRVLDKLEARDQELDARDAAILQQANEALNQAAMAPKPASATGAAPATVTGSTQAPPSSSSDGLGFKVGDTNVTFSGFVKLDASYSDFSDGELPSGSLGRDFYIPGLIPVGGDGDGADFDYNPRETRFIFNTKTNRWGREIGSKLEFDFQVTSGGDERVSNSFTPRLRQGYVTIDNWLIGQAWSTFQDVAALPDNLDFIGPTEGTVFVRQPMVRFGYGPWEVALEQPETTLTLPDGSRALPGDDIAPDGVVRYTHKRDWGHLKAAGIVRALHVEPGVSPGAQDDTAIGFGGSVSGKIKVGERDDFRFMATVGEGLGRYIGVNVVNDAALDGSGELETIGTYSGFASYRHFWNDKWRSNLTFGAFSADNPVEFTTDSVTDRVYSVHANLIYSVAPKVDIGIEYIYANRELESGLDGSLNRVQMSAKYGF